MQLRCVCLDLQFVDLIQTARDEGIVDVNVLRERTGCGTRCGSCCPLLQEILDEGKVTVAGVELHYPESSENARQERQERECAPEPATR